MSDEKEQIEAEALGDEPVVGFEEDPEGDVVIAFADDEQEEEPALVKTLRDQIRERDRKIAQMRRAPTVVDDDPEPALPERPRSVVDFDYDEDRFNSALDEHLAAREAHAEWKARQAQRENSQKAANDEQARRVEKQRNALGVSDYETRAAAVKETLSDAQLAVLINGADNPAQLIYALGRSETRLTLLAGEDNLAKFAVQLGKMEKEIKVSKRTAANPETMVRGATASLSSGGTDKHLERLEREAEKTGNRSHVQAYKRQLKQQRVA